jgi:hypothetical protein
VDLGRDQSCSVERAADRDSRRCAQESQHHGRQATAGRWTDDLSVTPLPVLRLDSPFRTRSHQADRI